MTSHYACRRQLIPTVPVEYPEADMFNKLYIARRMREAARRQLYAQLPAFLVLDRSFRLCTEAHTSALIEGFPVTARVRALEKMLLIEISSSGSSSERARRREYAPDELDRVNALPIFFRTFQYSRTFPRAESAIKRGSGCLRFAIVPCKERLHLQGTHQVGT